MTGGESEVKNEKGDIVKKKKKGKQRKMYKYR